jgi:hypothetical protein
MVPGNCGEWFVPWIDNRARSVTLPGEGATVRSLSSQLGTMFLVTVVVASLFGLSAMKFSGLQGVWASLIAGAISLPVGALVIWYLRRQGVSAESIVVGMLIRVLTTVLLAGAGVAVFTELRVPVFFLALGAIYLANLGVETWFALEMSSGSGEKPPGS